MLFHFALAITLFAGSDALFPLMATGGDEALAGFPAAAQARTMMWLFAFALQAGCMAMSWRAVAAAIAENRIFMVLMGFAIASASWSEVPWQALYGAAQLTVLTIFALAVCQRLPLDRALVTAALTYAVLIVMSLVIVVVRPELGLTTSEMYFGAWRGVFIHKNHFGTQLTFAFATFLSCAVLNRGMLRWISILVLAVVIFCCVMSRSTTALVICALMPICAGAACMARMSRSIRLALGGLVVMAVALGLAMFLGGWEWAMSMLGKDPDLTGRGELWNMIFRSIESRPILGFGYDTYWATTASDGGIAVTRSFSWSPKGSHNAWIETASQLGLAGLFMLAYVYARTIRAALSWTFNARARALDARLWLVMLLFAITEWSFVEVNVMHHNNSVHFIFALLTGYLVHLGTGRLPPSGNARGSAADIRRS